MAACSQTQSVIEAALEVEEIDINLYKSKRLWIPPGAKGVYGGQVIGQSLMAAFNTVDQSLYILHSLHCYFVLPGDNTLPIVYHVRNVRDGASFSTRMVISKQRGRSIFICECSFHKIENGVIYQVVSYFQVPMPTCPPPEECMSMQENYQQMYDDPRLQGRYKVDVGKRLQEPFPVDIRYVSPVTLETILKGEKKEGKQLIWFKTPAGLGNQLSLHQCVAAYVSDWGLLGTALLPHALTGSPKINRMVSLDHSIWFHSTFRADEWLLHSIEVEIQNTVAADGRAFSRGQIFTKDGKLIASTAQEGLIRLKSKI